MSARGAGRGEAVRRAAIGILARVERGAWSDRLLSAAAARFGDPRDRALLTRLVYGTLRWQLAVDEIVPVARRPVRERCAVRLAVVQAAVLGLPVPVAVSSVVGALAILDRRAAGRVNALLRRALAGGPPALDALRSVPEWLTARWERAYGAGVARALAGASTRPARPFVVDLATWADGGSSSSALVPGGEPAPRGRPATGPSHGRIAVDEGSAIVARLAADAPPGPAVDLAAAPGGKTLLVAHRRPGGLVAVERHAGRARALARRLAAWRGRVDVPVLRADAERPPLREESFASVLLDAPCSGTGTLRRRPERRMRVSPADISGAAELQRRLLEGAAGLVAPGGVLVYAVCSLEPEEGLEQVRSFLRRHPGFELEDAPAVLGAGGEEIADPRERRCVLTRPDLGDREGFQVARLRRRVATGSGVRPRGPAVDPG